MTSEYKSYADREKKRLKDKVAGQLRDMCIDIVKQAQANATQSPPKHPQVESGTMRRAITMDVDRDKLEGKVGIMSGKGEGDRALAYAPRIEFGFTGTDSKGRHFNQPPYPFLFPAAEVVTKKARDYFK